MPRLQWVVLLALVGCSEPGPTELRVQLLGQTEVGSMQPDLRFIVSDGLGLPLRVGSAWLEVQAADGSGWSRGPGALFRPGQVFFPKVALALGENTVRVTVIERTTGREGSALSMIRVTPEVIRVTPEPQRLAEVAPQSVSPTELPRSGAISVVSGSLMHAQSAAMTGPGISEVKPAGAVLFFVALTNLNLLSVPTEGYVADKVAGGDAQVDISFVASRASGGVALLLYAGVQLLPPVAIKSDPQVIRFDDVVFPHNTTGTLELRVGDADGALVSYSVPATVDVIPPAAPTLTATLATDGARTGKVDLSWSGGGDDGAVGAASNFDLRWTSSAILPTGITDEATFQDNAKSQRASGALFGAAVSSYQLTGLPPLSSYFLQVRAVDEVGNLSELGVQSQVDNFWSKKELTSGVPDYTGFGFELQVADLDGDGKSDLIVPSGVSEEVRIFFGQADLGAWSAQLLPAPPGSSGFGDSASAGDVTGDATNELAVGADWSEGKRGYAYLYFANGGAMGSAYVEFRGTPGAPTFFGGGVKTIADLNGDGIGELAISANGEGKTYVFFGRTQAQWLAARTGNELGTAFIPASAADRVFNRSGGGAMWGFQHGCANVPDLDGDGRAELILPNGGSVGLFSSGVVAQAAQAISMSSAAQTLVGVGGFFGFGSEVKALNVLGDAAVDLVVGASSANQVLIYPDGSAAGFLAAPITLTGVAGFGAALSTGDLNGDGRPDLVVGSTWIGTSSSWVLYNTGQGYDSTAGGGFAQANLLGGAGMGISTAVGDFNGDGNLDVVSGDDVEGRVTVWY